MDIRVSMATENAVLILFCLAGYYRKAFWTVSVFGFLLQITQMCKNPVLAAIWTEILGIKRVFNKEFY